MLHTSYKQICIATFRLLLMESEQYLTQIKHTLNNCYATSDNIVQYLY